MNNTPDFSSIYRANKTKLLRLGYYFNWAYEKILLSLILVLISFLQMSAQDVQQISVPAKDTILINFSEPLRLDTKLTKNQIKGRINTMTLVNIAGYGGSLLLFNNAWYKNFARSSFHAFNDIGEWKQVDKTGHSWAAYNAGKVATSLWRWTGMKDKKAVLLGGLSSAMYLTVIEIMDGFSAEWGWSWGDIGANIFGSALFMAQELNWKQQRIQYKFSFHGKKYNDAILSKRANALFGTSWYERMLKDYNGQTYWFSTNIKSFFPRSNIPAWLNVAIGYGAGGMVGGFNNTWKENGTNYNRDDIKRYRQWYLAPDIDLTKIKTKKKGVKILLQVLNSFKFPMPSLEFSNGKFRVNAISF